MKDRLIVRAIVSKCCFVIIFLLVRIEVLGVRVNRDGNAVMVGIDVKGAIVNRPHIRLAKVIFARLYCVSVTPEKFSADNVLCSQ